MPALPPENAGIIQRLSEAAFLLFSPPHFAEAKCSSKSAASKQESPCFMHERDHLHALLISISSAKSLREKS
jgi:hypothetical protein